MKGLNSKNCLVSSCITSCLLFILVSIFIFIAGRTVITKFFNASIGVGSDSQNQDTSYIDSTQISHLESKDKEIKGTVFLISDTENDFVTMTKFSDILIQDSPDALLHTGDITSFGVMSNLEQVRDLFSRYEGQVFFVPGDRDIYKSGDRLGSLNNFNEVFGENYRFVEIEGIGFLLIDNSSEYGGIDAKQYKFIDENMDKADFVVLHNPLYYEDTIFPGKGMGQFSDEVDKQRLDLLDKIRNSNVKAVFAGDQHIFSESFDPVDFDLNHYIVGAMSKDRSLEGPSFVVLTLYSDGDYSVEKVLF